MKYIDAAIERLKEKKKNNAEVHESELSLVERILAKESNPKMAYILALDLILVGIDTVNIKTHNISHQFQSNPILMKFLKFSDINGSMLDAVSARDEARGAREDSPGANGHSPRSQDTADHQGPRTRPLHEGLHQGSL